MKEAFRLLNKSIIRVETPDIDFEEREEEIVNGEGWRVRGGGRGWRGSGCGNWDGGEGGRVERKLHNTFSVNNSGFCDVVQVMLSPWRMG